MVNVDKFETGITRVYVFGHLYCPSERKQKKSSLRLRDCILRVYETPSCTRLYEIEMV